MKPSTSLATLVASILLAAPIAAHTAPEPALVSYSWLGGASSNWHESANWFPVGIPGPGDDVLFGSGANCVISADAFANNVNLTQDALVSISFGGDLIVSSNVTVSDTASLAISDATSDLEIVGNLTVAGGATASGSGEIVFTGTGTFSSFAASPATAKVRVISGTRSVTTARCSGMTLEGGTLHLNNAANLLVDGPFQGPGGTLSWDATIGNFDILDVNGNVEISGATCGTTTNVSLFRCSGDWNVHGGFTMSNGEVEFDGAGTTQGESVLPNVEIQTGGDRDLVADVEVAGNLKTTGSSSIGTGYFEMTGTSKTVTSSATYPIGKLRILAGSTSATTAYIGELEVAGGSLTVNNFANLRVTGDMTGTGGTIHWDTTIANFDYLDVDGDVTITGTVAGNTTQYSVFRCGGTWSSPPTWMMGNGTVELDESTAASVVGAGPIFPNLTIKSGTKTLATATVVSRTVTVDGGATFDVASQDLEVQGGWTQTGGGATAAGTGPVRFTGTGTLQTNANTLIAARIEGGTLSAQTSKIATLEIAGGTLHVNNAAIVTVAGDFLGTGGQLSFDTSVGNIDTLDVDGDVVLSGTVAVSNTYSLIRCAGNWTSGPGFGMADGEVEFNGAGTIDGGAVFPNVELLSGGSRELLSDASVTRALRATGASSTGAGFFQMTGGASEVFTTNPNSIGQLRIAGGASTVGTVKVGALEVTGGALNITNAADLNVTGNLLGTGGVINWDTLVGNHDYLNVDGDVTLAGTTAGTTTTLSVFRCGGDWSSVPGWVMASGTVELDESTAKTISGAGPTFPNLTIKNGSKTLAVATVVTGTVLIQSGATLALADQDLEVQGGWTQSATLAAATGDGPIRFTGVGTMSSSANLVPPIRVESGTLSASTSKLEEAEIAGGTLHINNAAIVTVTGDFLGTGGSLRWDTSVGNFDTVAVEGNVSIDGMESVNESTYSIFRCAGDWSSVPSLAMTAGEVEFYGAGTIDGGAALPNVEMVTGGARELLSDTTVSGSLRATGASSTGTGFFDMTGSGVAFYTTAPHSIGRLRISAGTASAGTVQLGDLEITGGELTMANAAVMSVAGDLTGTGGSFRFDTTIGNFDTLDVAGDVMLAGTTCGGSTNLSLFYCAGDFHANGAFAMASGRVELDGAGTTTVGGTAPGFDPSLPTLVVKNGTRQADNDFSLGASSIEINAGATLDAFDRTVTIPGTPVTVNGTLAVGAGGTWALAPTVTIDVTTTGTLRAVGAFGAPATLAGHLGGGYACTVNGTLAARNFRFQEMGPAGIALTPSSSLAPEPENLCGGVFDLASPTPGSVLLDMQTPGAHLIKFVEFHDTALTGSFNVHRPSGGTVSFLNWDGGAFGGGAFESDPSDVIDWLAPDVTTLDSFTALPGAEIVTLEWTTSTESGDLDRFVLASATDPGGPFTTVAEIAPTGPGSYLYVHDPATENIVHYYELSERLIHGDTFLLGDASAKPYDADLPATFRTVGAGGDFATIQDAINAGLPPYTVVRVEAGTYDGFTVSAPNADVHIVPDGSGPVVIDTTTTPIVIQNTAFGQTVELSDLTVNGNPSSPSVLVQTAFGLTILDEMTIHGGPGQAGVEVVASLTTAITRSDVDGEPGIAAQGSTVYVGGGSLDDADLAAAATLKSCGVTPVMTIDGSSTHVDYPGIQPELSTSEWPVLNQPFDVDVEAAPGSLFQLVASFSYLPVDLNQSWWQMLGMINALSYVDLGVHPTDPVTGQATLQFTLPPECEFLETYLVLQLATIQFAPTLEVRLSNAETLFPVPQ